MERSILNQHNMVPLAVLFLGVVALAMPELALAQDNALGNAVSGGLCTVINAITGNVGKAIATIAILILGISAFFGKVNWGLAMTFAIGIVGIFGAAAIAGVIAGGSGGDSTAVDCGGAGAVAP